MYVAVVVDWWQPLPSPPFAVGEAPHCPLTRNLLNSIIHVSRSPRSISAGTPCGLHRRQMSEFCPCCKIAFDALTYSPLIVCVSIWTSKRISNKFLADAMCTLCAPESFFLKTPQSYSFRGIVFDRRPPVKNNSGRTLLGRYDNM